MNKKLITFFVFLWTGMQCSDWSDPSHRPSAKPSDTERTGGGYNFLPGLLAKIKVLEKQIETLQQSNNDLEKQLGISNKSAQLLARRIAGLEGISKADQEIQTTRESGELSSLHASDDSISAQPTLTTCAAVDQIVQQTAEIEHILHSEPKRNLSSQGSQTDNKEYFDAGIQTDQRHKQIFSAPKHAVGLALGIIAASGLGYALYKTFSRKKITKEMPEKDLLIESQLEASLDDKPSEDISMPDEQEVQPSAPAIEASLNQTSLMMRYIQSKKTWIALAAIAVIIGSYSLHQTQAASK